MYGSYLKIKIKSRAPLSYLEAVKRGLCRLENLKNKAKMANVHTIHSQPATDAVHSDSDEVSGSSRSSGGSQIPIFQGEGHSMANEVASSIEDTTKAMIKLSLTTEGDAPGDCVDNGGDSATVATQPSSVQDTRELQSHTPTDSSSSSSTIESNSVSPTTCRSGASAGAHQVAVTRTNMRRDPETYPFPSNSTGWQFYLDYLASNLSANIFEMAVHLGLESGKVDEIKNRWKMNPHEMCFNILWTWYDNTPDNDKRINKITDALKKSGRPDLAQKLMEGKVPRPESDIYQGEIKNPTGELSDRVVREVGNRCTLTFQRLARYFGLDENFIQSTCHDNSGDIHEQSYKTIMLCIKHQKLEDRQQLCNGIAYLKQHTTISELNKIW